MSYRRPLHLVAALVLATGACDTDDGRDLAEPAPGATAPFRPTGTTSTTVPGASIDNPPVGSEEGATMALGSAAFAAGQPIPDRYACTGENVSPPLGWSGVPDGTVELALTVVDPDPGPEVGTQPFVHWAVTGIDPSLGGLQEGSVPETAVQSRNGSSEFGWFGPCPPAGETHQYVFTLFALTQPSGVPAGTSGADAIALVAQVPGVAATLSGTFTGS